MRPTSESGEDWNSHHAAVAPLPPEEQTEVLEEAKEKDYTVRQTAERVKEKQQARAETEAAENGRRVQHEAAPNYCAHCGSPESAWSRRPNDVEGAENPAGFPEGDRARA